MIIGCTDLQKLDVSIRSGELGYRARVSVREMKERAARLIGSGQLERAEVVLRQALTQAPRDVSSWLKHAEVLKRLSRTPAAVSSYRLAARILDDDGHHHRAVAALKLALAMLPEDVDLSAEIIRCEGDGE